MSPVLWYPKAKKVIIPATPGLTPLNGRPKIVLHTTEGGSIEGAEGAYRANKSTPHFTISPRSVHQHLPVSLDGYSLEHPSGTPQTNRAGRVVQIEQVGFAANTGDWPDSYYKCVRDLCLWIHKQTGVPMSQISNGIAADFSNPSRISASEWADWSGICGHVHVPNNHHTDPGRGYHIGKVTHG
jgi:hypothetical protein